MEAYSHSTAKFADGGLQLRLPVDLVPPSQYSRLTNAVPLIEGQLQTRVGLTIITTIADPIHTIFRLNQQINAVATQRLLGAGKLLYASNVPDGATFSALSTPPTYDGTPLTLVDFRFENDNAAWAVISNSLAMMKLRGTLYQVLGQRAPTTAATGADGGAGNLNNGAGPGFDWVYTFMNGVTRTESNPSPLNVAPSTQRPSANTNPDPDWDQGVCTNPANAYDNNPATYAEFVGDNTGAGSGMSCRYSGWASAGTGVDSLILYIDSEILASGATDNLFIYVYYSLDNGTTWSAAYTSNSARSRQTDNITLPTYSDTTQMLLRAAALYVSGGGTGGGGGDPCFAPHVRIVTADGVKSFKDCKLVETLCVEQEDGTRVWREADLIVHDAIDEPLLDMGEGEGVTRSHLIRAGEWVPAAILWDDHPLGPYTGKLYNFRVRTEREDERNYVLGNGRVAHNNKPRVE